MTDALLRSLGGSVALLRMPVAASSAIGEQLGLNGRVSRFAAVTCGIP